MMKPGADDVFEVASIKLLYSIAEMNGHNIEYLDKQNGYCCSQCNVVLFEPRIFYIWEELVQPCGAFKTRDRGAWFQLLQHLEDEYGELWS